jgi:ketosteroid isomerase-like protein
MNRLTLPLVLLTLAGCAPKLIPGTDIRDTGDNRAVFEVVDEYVRAMNRRDPAAVLALVAPDYFDDAGTPEAGDDLDRGALEKTLTEDLRRLDTEKLAVTVRAIDVQGDAAFAEIFYDNYYRVQTPAGPVPRRDTDVHRVRMKKLDGKWKIVAGL